MFEEFTDLNKEFINNIADKYKKNVILNIFSDESVYNPATGQTERIIISSGNKDCYVSKIDLSNNKYQGLNLSTESKRVIANENITDINQIIINGVKHKIVQEIQGAGFVVWLIDTL